MAVSSTSLATTEQLALRQGCWVAGVFALESTATRICHEAGARVGTNVWSVTWTCSRRVILTPGGWRWLLTACHSSTALSWRSTLQWCPQSGQMDCPDRGVVRDDGAALATARRLKERTYPGLTGQFGRARLVVLACEVGGRWSGEIQAFLRQLAKFKARTEALPQQPRARAAWLVWWRTMLACSGARVLAQSLMEVRPSGVCMDPLLPC